MLDSRIMVAPRFIISRSAVAAASSLLAALPALSLGECASAQSTRVTSPATGRQSSRELRVTTLQDYKPGRTPIPGSLRWAIANARVPCRISFDVFGDIRLEGKLTIDKPYLAIDGGRGPGGGITLQRQQVEIVNTHDVVLRNLRIRCGDGFASDDERRKLHGQYDRNPDAGGSGGWRSLLIAGTRPEPTRRIMIEHCSIQNATDDNANVWGNCRAVTFRYCIFSGGYIEASKGFLAGAPNDQKPPDYPDWLTIERCLFADVAIRTPDIAGGVCQFVNNVVVAPWQGARFTNARANVVNNVFISRKDHPWGKRADRLLTVQPGKTLPSSLHVSGNLLDGRPVRNSALFGIANQAQTDIPVSALRGEPLPGRPNAAPADQVLMDVLKNAGCTQPSRDRHDRLLIEKVSRAAGVTAP